MAVLFASSYAGALKTMVGTVVTSASGFDSTYSDASMDSGGTTVIQIQTPDFPSELTEGWAHCYMNIGSSATYKTGNFFGFYNSTRNGWDVVAYITNVSTVDYVAFQYWNGSAMVDVGTPVSLGSTGGFSYDLYFKKHASTGVLSFYRDGTLLITVTGLNLSNIAVNCARWRAGNSYLGDARFSQLLVAEESTVGARVFSPDLAAGAVNTLFAGVFSDVAVDAVRLQNTFIQADTNGQLATFACENLSTSLEAVAVVINTRSKRGTTGPSQLEILARVGGTNYSSDTKPLTVGMDIVSHVFDTNPATGLSWTNAAVDAAEFGVKAIT
jgi:hypothetical protein